MSEILATTEAAELSELRDRVKAWLEANATRRRHDTSEFKKRVSATTQSLEDELAHVATCKEWQRKIHDAGFAGLAVPEEYGGQGRTAAHQRVFQQEAARYEIDTGVFSVGVAMVVPTLLAYGTEEQKREQIPALLRGQRIWCQLFSEPGAGSDLASLTTRADRDGEAFVVNGQKVWNSFAHVSDWGILLVRTDWDVPKHRGITYLLVDMP
ncbi:MAG: acyl-CoA dehydrogenase family protein, partial [Acidimicrobiia bacterium]